MNENKEKKKPVFMRMGDYFYGDAAKAIIAFIVFDCIIEGFVLRMFEEASLLNSVKTILILMFLKIFFYFAAIVVYGNLTWKKIEEKEAKDKENKKIFEEMKQEYLERKGRP